MDTTVQLKDLVKPLDQMTTEELQEHLRSIRHRRTAERPVAKAKAAKAERKQKNTRMTSAEKLLAGLSEEDRAALIKSLEEANGTNGG